MGDPQAWRAAGPSDWRPFLRPLTDRTVGQTQKIATPLFDWLLDVGCL
ncbi:hypothetical protein [Paraburkholderia sp. BL6669N2]|nr:hypothetical protein [Paraburkholderia sp. BL6669N2]